MVLLLVELLVSQEIGCLLQCLLMVPVNLQVQEFLLSPSEEGWPLENPSREGSRCRSCRVSFKMMRSSLLASASSKDMLRDSRSGRALPCLNGLNGPSCADVPHFGDNLLEGLRLRQQRPIVRLALGLQQDRECSTGGSEVPHRVRALSHPSAQSEALRLDRLSGIFEPKLRRSTSCIEFDADHDDGGCGGDAGDADVT